MLDLEELTQEVLRDYVEIYDHDLNSYRMTNCLHPRVFNGTLCRCGHCILCRVSQRHEWSLRVDLEGSSNVDNSFTTLTYNDDCVPMELYRPDFQLFIRKLRKVLRYKVRFFASAEYGDNYTKRPHFHAVLFGHRIQDYNEVQKRWHSGFTEISCLSSARSAYVSGYVQKKLAFFCNDVELPEDFYKWNILDRSLWCKENNVRDFDFRIRPYALMSTHPGIGFTWYEKHKLELLDKTFIALDGKKHPIPRYFRKLLVDEFPDWQLFFQAMLEDKVYDDFDKFYKKYKDPCIEHFLEWQISRVKHRATEFVRKNELYLAKKRERNMKKYGGIAI